MGQGSSTALRPPTDSFLLLSSVTEGNSDIVALFLKKNPSLLYTSLQDRGSLLHLAALHGHVKTLQVCAATACVRASELVAEHVWVYLGTSGCIWVYLGVSGYMSGCARVHLVDHTGTAHILHAYGT
jgi:hypothetical protein